MHDIRRKFFLNMKHIIVNPDIIIGCVCLSCLMIACLNRSTNLIQSAAGSAKSIGKVVTVGGGDVSIRDIPKALAIKQGHLFGDPHYAGETNWYPFATPLLVAAVSYAFFSDQTIDYAYFMVGALTGALLIAATGGLLCAILGRSGLLTLPIYMSLGFFGLQRGVYPYATAHLPMVLYLTIACLLCGTMHQCSAKRINILFSLLGFLNGLLGVWHGASFFTATAISLIIVVTFLVIRLRARSSVSKILAPIVLYGSAVFLPLSMLIMPQIFHYGYLTQSDSARLWLSEFYGRGDIPKSFWGLELLPKGLDELCLIMFVGIFFYKAKTRLSALPLLAGYIFAISLAHFGFVVNCGDMFLSKLARTLLVAPPHTFNDNSLFIFIFIKMVVFGWIIIWLLKMISYSMLFIWQCMHSILKKLRCIKVEGSILHDSDRNVTYRDRILRAILLVSLVIAYAGVFLHLPISETLPTSSVDSKIYDFAQSASRIVGQQTIIGANNLINLAHFNILHLGSPPHSNPFVENERQVAVNMLKSGNVEYVDDVIRRYDVGYAIIQSGTIGSETIGSIMTVCKKETILKGPDGYSLVKLKDHCLSAE